MGAGESVCMSESGYKVRGELLGVSFLFHCGIGIDGLIEFRWLG